MNNECINILVMSHWCLLFRNGFQLQVFNSVDPEGFGLLLNIFIFFATGPLVTGVSNYVAVAVAAVLLSKECSEQRQRHFSNVAILQMRSLAASSCIAMQLGNCKA